MSAKKILLILFPFLVVGVVVVLVFAMPSERVPRLLAEMGLRAPNSSRQPSFRIANFTLLDLDNQAFRLWENKDKKAIVLFVYSPGCPIAQQQWPYLNKLRYKFASQGIAFYLIDSDFHIDQEKLREEVDKFKLDIPILLDSAQSVAKLLKINRTAEAILIDTENFNILYRGAMSDRFDYGGRKRRSNEFLEVAIEQFLAGKTIETKSTEPKGCHINIKTHKEVSFQKNIVPILKKHCISCHNSEGRAPWSMDSRTALVSWSKMITEVVLTKRMPPHVVSSEVARFKDSTLAGLSADEESMLLAWLSEQSAQQTEHAKNRTVSMEATEQADSLASLHEEVVTEAQGWPWGKPDYILTFNDSVVSVPDSGWVEWKSRYENFLPEPKWIRAAYIKTKNPKSLHHISLWAETMDQKRQKPSIAYIKKKEWINNPIIKRLITEGKFDWNSDLGKLAKGEAPYLTVHPGETDEAKDVILNDDTSKFTLLASLSSGRQRLPFSTGVGRYIPANARLRMLAHYKTIGRTVHDTYEVGLYFTSPKKPLHTLYLQGNTFVIPRNKKITHHFYHVFERPILVYGIGSHLHYRGRSQRLLLHRANGETKIILDHPNFQYDTNIWSNSFVEPVRIEAGEVIESIAQIDNTKWNPYNPDHTVNQKFGFQIFEEMIWASIDYIEL